MRISALAMNQAQRTGLLAVFLLLAALFTSSCASYMYGYTQREAEDRFLLIGDSEEDFGHRRLSYLMGYSAPIGGFVEAHGFPDMTFESTIDNRAAIALYYVDQDEVFVFIERNWNPNSRYLLDHRRMLDLERVAYRELTGTSYENSI